MVCKMLAFLMAIALTAVPVFAEEVLPTVPPLLPVVDAIADVISDAVNGDGQPADSEEEEWWNILLLGGDSRSANSYDRTDSIIIISLNRGAGEIKMTSIMRDTWVSIPGRSSRAKINAANVYGGPALAVETINNAFGTELEDYALVNMSGLVGIIDAVGGIEMEITESERQLANQYAESYWKKADNGRAYQGSRYLKSAGLVHLNGLMALSYCRNRYSDNDYGRVMRQQKVLMALAEKAGDMEMKELLLVVPEILKNVETNLTTAEITRLASFCGEAQMDAIEQFRIPADGTYESGMYDGTWSIRPDFDKNARLLHDFIYGE